MIYLDYSSTTPVDKEVLNYYVEITNKYIGNVNSIHQMGLKSKEIYENSIFEISECLNCLPSEIIITSGASESNALAFFGVLLKQNNNSDLHIVTSKLEHKSILDLVSYLKLKNVKINYVKIKRNGQIDVDDLERLINDKTILVSICGVNSETGFMQDLEKINKIIKRKNVNTLFHSDLTQGLGKTSIDLQNVDLATFSSHKIYAPKGCGILYKKRNIELDKMIYGTNSMYRNRGGTPALPLVAAFSLAIKNAINNLDNNINKVNELNKYLVSKLLKYDIKINSNELCVPHILNFSVLKMNSKEFIEKMSKNDICVSSTSACTETLGYSPLLYEIYNGNKDISTSSIRVSLSHYTTKEELDKFIDVFDKIINKKGGN